MRRYSVDPITGRESLAYVSPGSVRYDQTDIEFLLYWLDEMEEGIGPADPGAGYDGGRRTGIKDHGSHEAWCKVAAEIGDRLARCWPDHHLLREYYKRYENYKDDRDIIAEIGRANSLHPDEVTRRINSVKSYIASGECRRWVDCATCPRFSGCHKKKKLTHNIYSYREWVRSRGLAAGKR